MKAEDIRSLAEFASDAKDMALSLLSPLLDEQLTAQPVEAYAVYLANIRWATYQAIEALSSLQRMAQTAEPLWAEPISVVEVDENRRTPDTDPAWFDLYSGTND